MNKPLVSIVMTVYNSDRFVGCAIASVLNQTYENLELVIINDGSTDKSLEVCNRYASRDKRIILKTVDHQGITPSVIHATDLATGYYLGVVDDDDILHINALDRCVSALEGNKDASFVYTDHVDIDKHENSMGLGSRCQEEYSYRRMLERFITHHFRLIPREKFNKVGGWNDLFHYAADYDLCLRLCELADPIHLKEALYYYRIHDNNTSTKMKEHQARFAELASVMAQDRLANGCKCTKCGSLAMADVTGRYQCINCNAILEVLNTSEVQYT